MKILTGAVVFFFMWTALHMPGWPRWVVEGLADPDEELTLRRRWW